jgi:lantibiotic biosynthesis protein
MVPLRAGLRRFAGSPVVQEALFLASPDLHGELGAWLAGTENPRLEQALSRYFGRPAAKPTPFGLFAGVSFGRCGGAGELSLAATDAYRRRTRLSMTFVLSLAAHLAREERVRARLLYRANPGAYRVAGNLRHVERRVARGKQLHVLASTAVDGYVQAALDCARRPCPSAEIERALQTAFPELEAAVIEGYVGSLIDAQILVSDLAGRRRP